MHERKIFYFYEYADKATTDNVSIGIIIMMISSIRFYNIVNNNIDLVSISKF